MAGVSSQVSLRVSRFPKRSAQADLPGKLSDTGAQLIGDLSCMQALLISGKERCHSTRVVLKVLDGHAGPHLSPGAPTC